ncbi:MAG: hypothetical protein LBV43_00065 [Prevotella sp.]|nr:hypothetical protein [Prevotella sp.]
MASSLMTMPVFASNTAVPRQSNSDRSELVKQEQTVWKYVVNDATGVLLKRLWSLTYGKWLTDWITV